eukprot:1393524-Pyramimonas_sp.AAC.2
MVGLSASPELLQKLTFMCYNHHSEVMKIDTVRATLNKYVNYHVGRSKGEQQQPQRSDRNPPA